MTDKESLLDTLDYLQGQKEGEQYINTLNIIANLLRDVTSRATKATYERKFDHGKLVVSVSFNGMR